jgi:hypothetical protein
MNEIGLGTPRCPYEASQQRRQQEREPWTSAQVGDDAVPVGDPEVAELRRLDDLDL